MLSLVDKPPGKVVTSSTPRSLPQPRGIGKPERLSYTSPGTGVAVVPTAVRHSGCSGEERGQDEQHAERPRDVGENGRQYAAGGSALQAHHGSKDSSREDQYEIATGNSCQDIENRGYQHSVSHADGGKECAPEKQLLGDAVYQRDHADDPEVSQSGVAEHVFGEPDQ